jgi:protein involved in polysaccharide export with SLBB domain
MRKRNKSRFISTTTIEKMGLTQLCPLKSSANTFYVTVQPNIVKAYDLLPGDLLKVHLVEARKSRDDASEEEEKEVINDNE